jgi:transposase
MIGASPARGRVAVPAPFSMDLRVRVLADCDAGTPTKAVATKFSVSPAWVRRLKQRRKETGETAPRKGRTGPVPLSVTHADALRKAVEDAPDATLAELREALGLGVALSTMWEALDALGLTLKKKLRRPPNATGPT